jgi:outer membrane receptor protein involved in Fe transport
MSRIATIKRTRLRHTLAGGVSAAVLALWAGPALAQEEADDAAAAAATDDDDATILVTGSRIRTDGTQSPVPLTVVSAEAIESLSPGPIISGVSQLPQFYGNQTPNSGAFFTRSGTVRSTCAAWASTAR